MRCGLHAAVLALLLVSICSAFYLPGTGIRNYREGEEVEVQVNVLTSVNTHLPFDYYSLPACYPQQKLKGEPENLGEILMGDRIKPSPYEKIHVKEDVECQILCDPIAVDEKRRNKLHTLIKEDYSLNLIMDGLPMATENPEARVFTVGVPLGVVEGKQAFVYNHLQFTVKFYELSYEEATVHDAALAAKEAKTGATHDPREDEDHFIDVVRIISFVVRPYSLSHDVFDPRKKCTSTNFSMEGYHPHAASSENLVWSFGIKWERTDNPWQSRWDNYLNVADHEIHWFSIMNSTLIVLFLSAMVAVILMRTLRRDFSKYNRVDVDPEDLQEETGWKLVHKDVFRPPPYAWLLSALAGTGAQLFCMTYVVLIVACLGFLAPSNRGSLFTAMLVFFVFLGMYAGYVSACLLKLWGMPSWRNIFATGTVVPGVAFVTFFVINFAVWTKGSAGAVPFPTMIAVIALWFCISLPLVFVGAVVGYKRDAIKLPVTTNQIPRHIPPVSWHMSSWLTITIGGILPFGAVFIEVFFILSAVWLNRYYYVFGFLMLVMIILSITCAEITIVICYFQLCAEDYRWWWKAFSTSGSCGIYLFAYSIYYFFSSTMKVTSLVPVMIYFGYMGLLSYIFAVMTGTVGLGACFWFTRYIYGSIKID